MKAGGFLVILLAAGLLTGFTVPAAAHHPYEASSSSLTMFGGSSRTAVAKAVAEAPPLTGAGNNVQIVANVPLAVGEVPQGAKGRLRVEAFAKLRAVPGANTRGLTAKTFFRIRAPRR